MKQWNATSWDDGSSSKEIEVGDTYVYQGHKTPSLYWNGDDWVELKLGILIECEDGNEYRWDGYSKWVELGAPFHIW
jgi:hypothetical protein